MNKISLSTQVNPNMVVVARQIRGLTQKDLSKKTGFHQSSISKIEQGLLEVNDEILDRLSESLSFPKEFFYEPGGILNPGMKYFRKRKSVSKKLLNKIDSEFNVVLRHLNKLLLSVEYENKTKFLDLEEHRSSPTHAARVIRDFLNIPKGPIKNLTKKIEDVGIIIIKWDFETDKLDGFSYTVDNLPPVIFVNKRLLGDRLRFTLAHEFGHIVMHAQKLPKDSDEDEANEFAAEFLMPASEIRPHLHGIKIKKLPQLKKYWKTSMASIIKRAFDLDCITYNQYRYLNMNLSKAGWKIREPKSLDLSVEEPTSLKEIFDIHLEDLNYSMEELSNLLKLYVEQIREWYFEQNTNLKLVK